MDFKSQLALAVNASAPLIQIISHDTLRIRAEIQSLAKENNKSTYIWDSVKGLRKDINQPRELEEDIHSPIEVLDWIIGDTDDELLCETPLNFIILLEDFHHFLNPGEHSVISRLRNFAIAVAGRSINNITIILSQPIKHLPIELEKEVVVLDMPLPSIQELSKLAEQAKQKFQLDERDCLHSESFLNAAIGLSTSEAQLAFAKIAYAKKRLSDLDIPELVKEKEQLIKKKGNLEYFHPDSSLNEVGGLENLKAWLKRRRLAFSQEAKDFGLEIPRGLLMLGLPGTGKSLSAKAIANEWQLPLLRLDMGNIYGGIVGQSESNMRDALKLAEAISPSILWIDEIEKGFSGAQSSGATDGGTTARVLGNFLTWMQEKTKPVFVVATANNIAQLPPELLRKGRVDEIFFVDLPTENERSEVIKVHLDKLRRLENLSPTQINTLATLSKGFTGAELKEAIKEALFIAFDEVQELEFEHIKKALLETTPMSITMSEVIENTRKWAKGRAVNASVEPPEPLDNNKDQAIKLKSEIENPFV